MDSKTVLISGAGIAGPTLAYWLARRGFRPSVVERAGAQRSSGSPVDVRGPAVEVAERMGIMEHIRAASTDVTDLIFVDGRGRQVGRVNLRALQRATGSREVELPRGDLAAILAAASRDEAEFIYDDSIIALEQDDGGVDVRFERAGSRRFGLVIGADGLHSAVRRLAFGPEADFVEHLGLYVATTPLDGVVHDPRHVVMYNTPGRLVTIHPGRRRALVAFMFRSPALTDFDHRDAAQHKRVLAAAFADAAWRVPELLERMRDAHELFFDSVSRVRLPHWSAGRIALLGDAASCVSLFGDGSSLAIAGAFTLAEELARTSADHASAFGRYEARHRLLTDPRQQNVARGAALLIPQTGRGIAARNLATRLWPLAAAGGWAARRRAHAS